MDDDTTIGPDGFLHTKGGTVASLYVDGIKTGLLDFRRASVICLRLYEKGGEATAETDATPERPGVQVRMTEQTARALAHHLSEAADELSGVNHPRQ